MLDNILQSTGMSNPLLDRFFISPQERAKKDNGKKIVKAFYQMQTSSDTSTNNFRVRNARWIQVLLWAKGSQNMKEFLDYMNVSDGNKSWVNIDMTQQRIAPQFVGTLVESMAKMKTYACVDAIDDGSLSEKENRLIEALFRMKEAELINDVQMQSGIQLEPDGVFVPDDEQSAIAHFKLQDRLPKEIRFEEMLNAVKSEIKFDRVANRKTIYDLITINCAVTKIEKLSNKKYTVRKCVPTNMAYNFFINDSGDLEVTMIGEFYNVKVKDFREKYGKTPERPDGLTEEQIFNLAKLSTNKSVGVFNYMWDYNWALTTFNQNRPYDDCSILVFDCEINCGEDIYYVEKDDAFGRKSIYPKTGVPYQVKKKDGTVIQQEKPEDVNIIKRNRNTWMRGVYAPYGDIMLLWDKPDLIITPYLDVAKPMSSYTINIPNNDGEYVPSLFERIMEPLREYTITKLKRKQLIAKIKPSGIRIDVESARNLDLGNGDTIAWEEVVRIYDQTGNELWSSKGLDPLERTSPPLSNTVQNTAIQDVIGLTNILLGIVNEIRQLIGVPMYRDGSDVGDRTAAKLAEGQNQSSYNVTDFIVNANNQLWEETDYKLCLLHWNDIVKEEPESKDDMINTRFQVSVKTKSTEYQKQLIEQDIQRYSQMPDSNGNPLISPKDALMIRNIEDDKLAIIYLNSVVEENRKRAIQDSQRLQQQNAQVQQQSAKMAAEQAQLLQKDKLAAEKEMKEFESTKKKEEILLQGYLQVAAKDESGRLIQQFMPAIQQLVPNIAIPLAEENKQMVQVIQANAEAEMQEQMMMQQEGQEQPIEQDEEQMAIQ